MAWGRSFSRFIKGLYPSEDTLEGKVRKMRRLFQDLDRDVAAFHRGCGFECLGACGHCCQNPRVEAAALEMLPLAWAMVRDGTAEAVYREAERHDFSGRCLFYKPVVKDGEPGHCSVYPYRPLVCRLFSLAGNRDKSGKARLLVCAAIKHKCLSAVRHAEAQILAGRLKMPTMSTYVMRSAAIDPDFGRERVAINRAFKMAVERVSVHQRFFRDKESRGL